MFYKVKSLFIGALFLSVTWFVGSAIYRYFTFSNPPIISFVDLEHGGTYSKDLRFMIAGDNDYKIKTIIVTLDDKELDLKGAGRVGAKQFSLPLVINTLGLNDGKHVVQVEAHDSSYHANGATITRDFFVDNTLLRALFAQDRYLVDQGKTLHAKITTNKPVKMVTFSLLGKDYYGTLISDDAMIYEVFIPIESEETPQEVVLSACVEDLVKNVVTIQAQVKVVPFAFKKQRGFVISQEKLTEESELFSSHRVLEQALEKWLEQSPRKKMWHGPFETPIEVQRVATPFGEIRVTPERGRHLHKGIDLINRPRCTVWAAQTGRVIIKDRFFLTGNTVVLDHGLGVFTLYGHLEDFADIQVGDVVKKGNPLGKMGMTGYATGYHLHWEVRVNNVPVDPMEWTKTIF